MATIFFTSIGSAIGNFVGFQSVGSFLGGEIGSFISQKLFNKENEKIINSSRLDDLLIQTSSYGRLIPICFGNMRIAGNIIWSMPLKEVLSTEIIESDGGGFLKGLLSGSYSNNSKINH